METLNVLKVTCSDFPDNPCYVSNIRQLEDTINEMILDDDWSAMPRDFKIEIVAMEMTRDEIEALQDWEPVQ